MSKSAVTIFLAFLFLTSWMLLRQIDQNASNHKPYEPISESSVYSGLTFLSDDAVIQRTSDCASYFEFMNNISSKKSRLSDNNTFPLAFAISAHFQVGILELFLATSFDPLDSYCIHVDAKADEKVTKAVDQMVKCYQWKHPKATIFTVDDPISVLWGHFSVLEADLKCMQLLRTKNAHWNMLINPAGTELPLKPMPEIRQYLEKFPNGIVDSFPLPEGNKGRFVVSKENTK